MTLVHVSPPYETLSDHIYIETRSERQGRNSVASAQKRTISVVWMVRNLEENLITTAIIRNGGDSLIHVRKEHGDE